MFALEFPPINEILRWTDVVPSVNKIALIAIAAVVVASVVFLLAAFSFHAFKVSILKITHRSVLGFKIFFDSVPELSVIY